MTSLPAPCRDFARQTSADDDVSIGEGLVLPDLPIPGPFTRVVLALFEDTAPEIEILIGPGLRLH